MDIPLTKLEKVTVLENEDGEKSICEMYFKVYSMEDLIEDFEKHKEDYERFFKNNKMGCQFIPHIEDLKENSYEVKRVDEI